MFCAHINKTTYKEQSVKEHLLNVAKLSKEYASKISFEATGELVGILHDMGKGTKKFDTYIRYCIKNPNDRSLKGTINHSTAGAKLIYDKYFNTSDPYRLLTAQLISLATCSHHGGLIDCLDLKGIDRFTEKMTTNHEIFYDEALNNFKDIASMSYIDKLFNESKNEIKSVLEKIKKINLHTVLATTMLLKYIFSCLIDADRYDTYTFMEDKEKITTNDKSFLWEKLQILLENKLENFSKLNKINKLREEISISCKRFAINKTGIYRLAVPTGGGKTLSSLRYALEHAKKFDKERIFYIIPFTTIIDQNAKEIKDIIGREDIVLEHHSNIVKDNEDEEYKILTERWDSPIIFTTMVQFLNTLFKGGTQSVRRMHNLANSIIIFDEIQALPIKCINMFNSAINFLSNICKTTIILCTATQPLLNQTSIPLKLSENPDIIEDIHKKFAQFKRVNVIDKCIIGGYLLGNSKSLL